MRVIISAGGTGGHIYPALAIVSEIKKHNPDSTFLYIGTLERMEKDIVPKYGIDYKGLDVKAFSTKKPFSSFKEYKKAYKECQTIVKDFKPDVVIGVGGYITVPVILAAHKLGIKTFIHEQNSVPGKANALLSKYANKIGVSFKGSLKYFPPSKTFITGNPCGDEALNQLAVDKSTLGLSDDKKLVLIVMGSLGSSKVNEYLIKILPDFKSKDYEILLVSGEDNYDMFKNLDVPSNVKIASYIEGLPRIMKRTDLMVSRAGASALSEIISLELPAILIPSPYVSNNHQYKNAIDLISNDAAILLEEKDLVDDSLIKTVDEVINDDDKLLKLKSNMKELKVENSSHKIYKIIEELVGKE